MANLPLAFAELLGGGVLLTAGLSGSSVPDVFSGSVSLKSFDAGGSAATAAPAPSATGTGAKQGAVSMGDLAKIGAEYGWSGAELHAWWSVISQESGGDPQATNPSSGAFGIGQFLGKTKTEYASYGATSRDPMQQLTAMAKYIHDRYGTPQAAEAFHLANGWY